MTPAEQRDVLLTVGCAFFRAALHNHHPSRDFLAGLVRAGQPIGPYLRHAFQYRSGTVIDDHERGGISTNTLGGANDASGVPANEYHFGTSSAPVGLRGDTGGVVIDRGDGFFRYRLPNQMSFAGAELWLRAAEVDRPTSFEVGLLDDGEQQSWVKGDDVGALPSPWPHSQRTSVLSTFRLPGACFSRMNPKLNLDKITAVLLRVTGERRVAFDDIHRNE